MIKGECFICLALNTWESDHMNTLVQMMGPLSKHNKVLYVDYQYTLKDIISSFRGKRNVPVKKVTGIDDRLSVVQTKYGSEVYVLNVPPVIPVNWMRNDFLYDKMLHVNADIIRGTIKKAAERLGFEEPIVVSGYNPFYGLTMAGDFNEKLNVYYCYDEIKGDQCYQFHGPRVEQKYLQKTDVVIATSDALYESKSTCCSCCNVVKNGVDFDLFHQAAGKTVKDKPRKVIGYTGSIDERFHTEVVVHAAENLPETDFLFVGRITNYNAANALSRLPNVKLLGSRRPEEVPEFLKRVDVTMIPYLKNKVTSGVYPLKINEYLAAGKPVAMTNFAELPEFKNLVSFASNKEEFLNALRFELNNDTEEKQLLRIETARKNSWDHRVEEFSDILNRKIAEKRKKAIEFADQEGRN